MFGSKLSDHQWTTEVMKAVNAPGIRLGVWCNVDRDIILRELIRQRRERPDHFELIVDDGRADFRIKNARDGKGVRLADYRTTMIGRPEDPAVTAVNEALARIGG